MSSRLPEPVGESVNRPCGPIAAHPRHGRLRIFGGDLVVPEDHHGFALAIVKTEVVPERVVGVDPGSKFEGFSVVGTQDTVLNAMSEAPTHVKKA